MGWISVRRATRATFVSLLVLGSLVVAASPAFAAINVTFSATGLPSGVTINVGGTFSNGGCQAGKVLSTSFASPGPGGTTGMCNTGAGELNATYPATVNTAAGDRYTFGSFTPAMPYTIPTSGTPNISGSYTLTCQHLVITAQPATTQTKTFGDSVTFSVTVTGTSPQYQWRKGTTNIGGANGASYTIPSVSVSDAAANYNVVVSNSCGATPASVTSNNAALVVNKANPTITWSNPANITYGTPLSATQLNATASVPGSFVYTPAAGSVLGAGSHGLHVAFTPTAGANYNNATGDVTLGVDPALLTAAADDAGRDYGAADPAFTATYSGFVNGENASVVTTPAVCSSTATSTSPVGTYPITCSGAAAANYTFQYEAGELQISNGALVVTATGDSRVYGADNPALGATIAGFANGEDETVLTATPTCTTTADASSPVGTYPITCSGAAAGNYDFSYVAGTLTVLPAPLSVSVSSSSRDYGAANPAFTPDITGFVNGEDDGVLTSTPVCTTTADGASPVGEYPITCAGGTADNYDFSYTAATLTVGTATLTITANPANRAYGATNPALDATVTGFVNGEDETVLTATPTCTTAADETSPAGAYPITCSGAAADNYAFSYVAGSLTVGPLTLTVTADDESRAYGAANPAFTASITGFVNGDDESDVATLPVCSTTADEASPVGTYPITCSGAVDADYDFSYTAGTLTVDPAPLTVTGNDAERAYGAADPTLDATVTGFVNGEDGGALATAPTCTTTATTSSPVGFYPITCSSAAADNYEFTYVDGTMQVTVARLDVVANNASRVIGEANPAFTATVTGFVNGEDETVLTSTPTCTSPATPGSPPGTYPISCGSAAAPNYAFFYTDGSLTVNAPAGPIIRIADASVREGSGPGKKNSMTFVVTVDRPVSALTTVNWATSNGTAVGGKASPADYVTKTTGKVTFKPGKRVGYINVSLLPDSVAEGDETFVVNLSGATAGATIASSTATGTILEDDDAPGATVGIGDTQMWEGNAGAAAAGKLWVTLSAPQPTDVSVTVAVTGGSATAGKASPADYKTFKTKTLLFRAGQYKKPVSLSVLPDALTGEGDETVIVTLSAATPGLTITRSTGVLTIKDDD